MERKVLRIGAAVIICAVLLRLLSSTDLAAAVTDPEKVGAALLFLSTGRVVRPASIRQTEPPEEESTQEPTQPEETPPSPAVFTAQDAALVRINNAANRDVDVQAMLQTPLGWDLTEENGPTVLILHTHGSESYTKTEDYTESASYRTLDENYNVVSVGDRLTQALEAAGIAVLHDRTMHDHPSYNGSYEAARKKLQAYLAEYPSIRLVLDIHRDAMEDSSGNQIGYTVQTDQGEAAKLMLVVGSDAGSLYNPRWRENLTLAVKLQAQLEKVQPGICRPLGLRSSRFNQDLMQQMVLVEVGAAGNTRQQALLAADILAQSIVELAQGAVYQ